MATLTIDFAPVVNATSYEVCYKPTFATNFTCQTITNPPLVITAGINCDVDYDVTVAVNCSNGLTSIERQVTAVEFPCPQPPRCYTVNINTRIATGNYISYNQEGVGIVTVLVTSLPFNDGFYIGGFCSQVAVTLVDANNIVQDLTDGSTIAIGAPCTSDTECAVRIIYTYNNVGSGATACTQQSLTLYSDCPSSNFGTNCYLYTDLAGMSPLTDSTAFVNGVLWDIDPAGSGQVVGQNSLGCNP